jgi:hypothetical protein
MQQQVYSVALHTNTVKGMSWLMRFLGAKVGKGVFHSGTGFETVDYDLIEVSPVDHGTCRRIMVFVTEMKIRQMTTQM